MLSDHYNKSVKLVFRRCQAVFAAVRRLYPASAFIAYQRATRNTTVDYWLYNAGATLEFRDHYKLDLRYYNTMICCFPAIDLAGCLAASIKAEF
jgi:hypothetical protein